jgi:DNA-binding PadR family transcriptional regulator
MTITVRLVLRALLHADREMHGREVCELTGLASGTVHPILARFEGLGWLTSRWEDADPVKEGRPKRRYYRFGPDGADQARAALARTTARLERPDLI